jgi:hypothetical protein
MSFSANSWVAGIMECASLSWGEAATRAERSCVVRPAEGECALWQRVPRPRPLRARRSASESYLAFPHFFLTYTPRSKSFILRTKISVETNRRLHRYTSSRSIPLPGPVCPLSLLPHAFAALSLSVASVARRCMARGLSYVAAYPSCLSLHAPTPR